MQSIKNAMEKLQVYKAISLAGGAYEWFQERLWPIYSTGIVVSAMCIIAAAHEKQLLADHLYGNQAHLRDEHARQAIVTSAGELLTEENSTAVRQDVWMMDPRTFASEYMKRHGSA